MIPGRRVILLSTQEPDLPALLRLWNDGTVMQWVGFPEGLGYDLPRMQEWLRRLQANPNRHHFTVYAGDGMFCGESYCALDPQRRRASLDIKFVPEAQGRGRSRDALGTLIGWVFRTLPEAEAVWVEPWPNNLAARTLYYSCGLRQAIRPADLAEGPSYWELTRQEWSAALGEFDTR
jgi:RimJ/RimL family protein N-acetyltransferase